jgi:hypothetical protein
MKIKRAFVGTIVNVVVVMGGAAPGADGKHA